jgi:uncharacterized protein (TIGR02118 family)
MTEPGLPIAYMILFSGNPSDGIAFRAWAETHAKALKALPGVTHVDYYAPGRAVTDPYLDDGPGPLLQVQIGFRSVEDLEAALAGETLRDFAVEMDGCPCVEIEAVHQAMRQEFFPVAGEDAPAPLTAPVSYVVRYHRPAEDEEAFRRHYTKHHPPILGKFSGIRNVVCYYPVAHDDPLGLPSANYMLGNEVVFDSFAALDASLNSPVRHELREDFRTFPPFTGRNTHYAMERRRID